MIVASK